MALRVWLPLNGNLENKGLGNLGKPSYNDFSIYDNGKIGKAYQGNIIYHLGNDFLSNKWTIALWVKKDTDWIQYNDILLCKNGSTSGDAQFYLSIISGAKLNIGINLHSEQYTYNYTFTTNTWYHIAAAFDGANYYLYLNGELVKTGTDTSTYSTPALNFCIGTRSQNEAGTSSYGQSKIINDVRIYDECLSPKQIKEISKGLVAHYKLDNPYTETTINLAPGINSLTPYTTNNSPAWDTTLNGTPMINPSGWSNGYNSGVTDPTNGYHAHWIRESGQWEMIFPNLNSVIGQTGRWEGISGSVSTQDILAGEKYTISWWQKTDNLNLAAWGGIYYKKTSDGTTNFWDSCPTLGYNTKLNTWQFMYKTFTRSSEYVQHDGGQSIYVYGGNSNEGTIYVKDVQIVRGDHPLPYAVGTRNGQSYEVDCSGNGYTATKSGTLTFNSDSPRYSGSMSFSSSFIGSPAGAVLASSKDFTITGWFYHTSGTTYYASVESYNTSVCLESGRFFVYPSSGGAYVGTWSATNNVWQMVTLVHNSVAKTLTLFVNGVQTAQVATDGTIYANNTLNIGGRQNSADYKGSVSDFRIYATALSADDIKNLYMVGASIDNNKNYLTYEFKEPNIDFFEINNLNGVTNLKNNSYLISHTAAYDGASIPISNFVIGKTYKMSYHFQKIDGSLQWMGGHAQGYSNIRYYIDGKYISAGYPSNTTSVDFIDDANIHLAEVYFTCVGGTTNDALYIQPNRGEDVATTVKIYDLKFSEVSFPENNNMNIDKRGLTYSTNLLQINDRSNITENYSLVANSFIET